MTEGNRASIPVKGLAFLALVAFYYYLNPGWYGDTPWYAGDIGAAASWHELPHDSGHLAWRPLGYWLGRCVPVDPWVTLRVLASVFTAGLVFVTHGCAVRLGTSSGAALLAAFLVAISNFAVAYGGSGSSYTASAMCALAAIAALCGRPGGEWSASDLARSVGLFVLGWSFWGTAVVALPAFGVAAFLGSAGGPSRRVLRSAIAMLVAVAAVVSFAWVFFRAFVPVDDGGSFLRWVRSAGHGLDLHPSVMGTFRAVYGAMVGVVFLGDLGTSIKGLVLGDDGLVRAQTLAWAGLVALVLVALTVVTAVRITIRSRHRSAAAIAIGSLTLVAFAGNAVFAALWQGSDIERYAYSVPYACIAFAFAGLDGGRRRATMAYAVAAVFLVANVGLCVVPNAIRGGGIVGQLVSSSRRWMGANDLLVVAGKRLGANTWGAFEYLSERKVFSISRDVEVNGGEGWARRLETRVSETLREGGRVFVLSDLVGEPTPGGIGWSAREYPVPTLQELETLFSAAASRETWSAGEYRFVLVDPPTPSPSIRRS